MCSEKLVDLVFILATKVLLPTTAPPNPQPQLDRNVDDMRSQLGETAANNEERFGLLEGKAKMQVGRTGPVAVITLL